MMSAEKNVAVVEEFIDAYNRGDAESHVRHTSPDCLLNGEPFGRDGDLQRAKLMIAAFPDGAYRADDLIAGHDEVVLRWTFSGTHQGHLMGVPPTGKQVTMAGITIYHLAGDMVVEVWEHYDKLGLLQQLGVIPELG